MIRRPAAAVRQEAGDSSADNAEDDCKLEIDQPRPLAIWGGGETNHGDKDVHTPKAHDHAARKTPQKEFQREKRNVHRGAYHKERKCALSASAADSEAM